MVEKQNKGEKMKENIFDELKDYCPRGYITRSELKKITGGLICGRTMALLDQSGNGVRERQIIGRKVVYLIDDLIDWLKNNVELVNFDD